MSLPRKILVFGPAYVDRVVRVDRPLIDPAFGGVIDGSAMGRWKSEETAQDIEIHGLPSGNLALELPSDWPGPWGLIEVNGQTGSGSSPRAVRCVAWQDDLGGMGAGYAKALGGRLHMLTGDPADAIQAHVLKMLKAADIAYQSIPVPRRSGEWTLLLSSGEYGDKLPIGFRDPNPVAVSFAPFNNEPCDLLVAASMTNELAAAALSGHNASVRLFAPAMRNMIDVAPKISQFVKFIDILCCNRAEWESLGDREEVAWRVSLLVVTDGPRGAEFRYTTPTGDPGRLEIPAFPRRSPPKDTNRAGEAFAATFLTTLLDLDWTPGTTSDELIKHAAARASAAAALVLDRVDFGFPSGDEIDRAIHVGIV